MRNYYHLLLIILNYFTIQKTNSFLFNTPFQTQKHKLFSTLSKVNHNLTKEEIVRYSRHLVLDDVGLIGQSRLKNSNVLVIGAGGLGSPCLMYLAAAGIGHIGIVDGDIVSESNLQRQIIHSTQTINVPKTQSSKQTLQSINPYTNIYLYEEELTSSNAYKIFTNRTWDIVIDGSDNFPTKYLINDICEILNISFVYSAVLKFEGQMSVFNYPPNVGPTYRDFLPEPPNPNDIPSCAEGGVVGVLPGVLGVLQATEAIKIILKEGDVCSGRILIYDGMKMKFSEVHVHRLPERAQIKELIDYQGFCREGSSNKAKVTVPGQRTMDEAEDETTQEENLYHTIKPKECLDKLLSGWTPYIIDVRLQTEHDIVSLPFTDKLIPHRQISKTQIPSSDDVLLYCKAGARSKKAIQTLIDQGVDVDRLWNLDGGIMNWRKEVDLDMPLY